MGEGVYLVISDICNAFVFAPLGRISPLFTFFSGDDSGFVLPDICTVNWKGKL